MNKRRDVRVCFVGDSLVNGTGDETKLGWAGRLCAASESSEIDVTYYNLGIRRNTSLDVKRRWEEECVSRFVDGCENIVVFSFGINDTVIENNELRVNMIDSIKNAKSILVGSANKYSVKMIGPTPIANEEQNKRIRELDLVFIKLCNKLSVPYLSVFEKLCSDQIWMNEVSLNDGAHPKSGGYISLFNIVENWNNWDL